MQHTETDAGLLLAAEVINADRDSQAPALLNAAKDSYGIAELAKLTSLEYDRVRKEKADALEVRVQTLDKAVQAMRNIQSADGDYTLAPEEPWPKPVVGTELLDSMVAAFERFCVLPKHAAVLL